MGDIKFRLGSRRLLLHVGLYLALGIRNQITIRFVFRLQRLDGKETAGTSSVAHGDTLNGETGFLGNIHDVEAGHHTREAEADLGTGGAAEVRQVQRRGVGARHGEGADEDVVFRCTIRVDELGLQFQEVCFGGHAGGHRIGGLTGGGLHQRREVIVRLQSACGIYNVELGAVGDAIELHEQAFGKFQQAGGGVGFRTRVEVEAERLDTGEMRQAGVVAVVVQFLKGVRAILGEGTEHVDIKGFDEVFIFRGNGVSGTTGGDGGFQRQIVL